MAPDPRPLFFSGGTAIRGLSRALADHTAHSVHLVTPFDSGGSSAELRRAFGMPAVGDLRNRLLALADPETSGRGLMELLSLRLPARGDPAELRERVGEMEKGTEAHVRALPREAGWEVRRRLRCFLEAMPDDFDLRRANVGNLVMAGSYLESGRSLEAAVRALARLVGTRGIVRPVVSEHLHLVARLEDGTVVAGQHRLTGRSAATLASPVRELFLSPDLDEPEARRPRISVEVDALIRGADLICYPMGSFYTSLVATLLPDGVGEAVAATSVPKLYVPNPGGDPEERGLSLADKVEILLGVLGAGPGGPRSPASVLEAVLVDVAGAGIPREAVARIESAGVQVLDRPLMDPGAEPRLDDGRLLGALLQRMAG